MEHGHGPGVSHLLDTGEGTRGSLGGFRRPICRDTVLYVSVVSSGESSPVSLGVEEWLALFRTVGDPSRSVTELENCS